MPRPPKEPRYEAILERLNGELAACAESGDGEPRFSAPLLLVGGTPRSGTTLCYQLLAATGAFVYPSNLVARFYRRPVMGWRVERLLEPYLPAREVSEDFRSEAGRTEAWHEPSEMGYFWHAFLPFEEHHQPSAGTLAAWDAGPLARELAALQSEDGRPLVVKNPILGFVLGWLLERVPEARVAWVSRPAEEVEASILRTRREETGSVERWWSTRLAPAAELAGLPPEEQVAAQVAALREAGDAARARHPDRWLDVEYRDLCHDPAAQVERIVRFARAPAGEEAS